MSDSDSQPFVIIVAGPNGSGKSTLTRYLSSKGVDFGVYINPDDIAATLTGSYDDRVRQAQALADEGRLQAIKDRISFSFETVMSHSSKLDVLRIARKAGFVVHMYFIATTDAAINVERVANRVAEGGHDVPEDKIKARYERVMHLAPEAIMLCNRAVVFDNSSVLRPLFETRRTGEFFEIEEIKSRSITKPESPQWPDWANRIFNRLVNFFPADVSFEQRTLVRYRLRDLGSR